MLTSVNDCRSAVNFVHVVILQFRRYVCSVTTCLSVLVGGRNDDRAFNVLAVESVVETGC